MGVIPVHYEPAANWLCINTENRKKTALHLINKQQTSAYIVCVRGVNCRILVPSDGLAVHCSQCLWSHANHLLAVASFVPCKKKERYQTLTSLSEREQIKMTIVLKEEVVLLVFQGLRQAKQLLPPPLICKSLASVT